MKNLIFACTFFTVTLITGMKTKGTNNLEFDDRYQENKVIATFDGAEGNYFFFTDSQENALQFEYLEPDVRKSYDLVAGNFVGRVFDVTYNKNKILNLKSIAK